MSSSYNINIFVGPSTKTSISNGTDALSHYRGGSGETVPANGDLISEMKNDKSFKEMINNLKKLIRNKITDEKIDNEITISAANGSRRGIRCATLGSYSVNIDYSFIPTYGQNYIVLHFDGSDTWDFEWNENKGFFHNMANEFIPGLIAGKGTPFDITYELVL